MRCTSQIPPTTSAAHDVPSAWPSPACVGKQSSTGTHRRDQRLSSRERRLAQHATLEGVERRLSSVAQKISLTIARKPDFCSRLYRATPPPSDRTTDKNSHCMSLSPKRMSRVSWSNNSHLKFSLVCSSDRKHRCINMWLTYTDSCIIYLTLVKSCWGLKLLRHAALSTHGSFGSNTGNCIGETVGMGSRGRFGMTYPKRPLFSFAGGNMQMGS